MDICSSSHPENHKHTMTTTMQLMRRVSRTSARPSNESVSFRSVSGIIDFHLTPSFPSSSSSSSSSSNAFRLICVRALALSRNVPAKRDGIRSTKRRKDRGKWEEDDGIIPPALRDVETAADFLEYAVFRFTNPTMSPPSTSTSLSSSTTPFPSVTPYSVVPAVSPSSSLTNELMKSNGLNRRSKFKNEFRDFFQDFQDGNEGRGPGATRRSMRPSKKLAYGQMTLNAEEDAFFLICEHTGLSTLSTNKVRSSHMSSSSLTSATIVHNTRKCPTGFTGCPP